MQSQIASELEGPGFYVAQFKTPELAIFSYYVESEGQAALIDPTFDTKDYQNILDQRKCSLHYVFLTHYHADFLSGHTQLKAKLVMGKNARREANKFELHEAEDCEQVKLGSVKLEVIHTPGHTLESSCFLLYDRDHVPAAIFTGDTVFMGDVGRPDLAANSALTKNDLAGFLYDSVQKLKKYADDIRLYPAHGAGSACGKAIKSGNFCSLGEQKKSNYGFTVANKETFVKQVTCIAEPPKYFFYDSAVNQTGSVVYEEIKKRVNVPLSLEQFRKLSQDNPIVDTRVEIGKGLIKGSYWLPASGAITAWLSNLLAPEAPFLLLCEEEGKFEEIADRLLRIGYFNILGYNKFSMDDWPEQVNSPKIIHFEEFKQLKDITHVDVRNIPEYQSTGIAENSLLIPLPQLPLRVTELNGKENIVISCRTGLRARVAYSVLARDGLFPTVFIEHFEHFAQNGIKVVPFSK